MRFAADRNEENKGPKPVSPYQIRSADAERSMLQVPLLAAMGMADAKLHPHKRPRYEGSSPVQGPLHWSYGESPAIWGGQFLSEAPQLYNLKASSMGGQYPAPSFGTDPRISTRRSSTPESVSPSQQYSPPQVRSGRGAMRITSRAASSPSTTPGVRQGISVSNRGKGPRKPAACRSNSRSSPSPVIQKREGNASPTTRATAEDSMLAQSFNATQAEAERVGNSVQGIAIAISRKVKRKLPMACKKPEETQIFAGETMSEDHKPSGAPQETTLITTSEPVTGSN
jgi:hypothetical protein